MRKTIAAFLLVLILSMTFFLSGCSKSISAEEAQTAIINTLSETVNLSEENKNVFLEEIVHNAKIEVKKVEINDNDEPIAICVVSNYNVSKAVETVMNAKQKSVTKQEAETMLVNSLRKADTVSKNVEIKLSYSEEDELIALVTTEQLDAILGGYMSYVLNNDLLN